MKPDIKDFVVQANKGGYMVIYKGIKLGGAGTMSGGANLRGRAAAKQSQDYREMGQREIDTLIRIYPTKTLYTDLVNEIDNKKTFYRRDNIGKAKYTISSYDGIQKHKDGSPFFGIDIFKNKKKLKDFTDKLLSEGYTERG